MIRRVSRRAVIPHVAGDRIGHRVRKMHARVPEPDPRVGRRQQHARARFIVGRILDARTRYLETMRSASSDQISLIGFEPFTRRTQ